MLLSQPKSNQFILEAKWMFVSNLKNFWGIRKHNFERLNTGLSCHEQTVYKVLTQNIRLHINLCSQLTGNSYCTVQVIRVRHENCAVFLPNRCYLQKYSDVSVAVGCISDEQGQKHKALVDDFVGCGLGEIICFWMWIRPEGL